MEYYRSSELSHYGLKGMKWGTRRWQYSDGRFNEDGKARYFGKNSSHRPDSVRELQSNSTKNKQYSSLVSNASGNTRQFDKEKAKRVAKKVAIGAAIVGGTVLLAYGSYKIHQVGGFSSISKNLMSKIGDTKLQNLPVKKTFDTARKAAKAVASDKAKQMHRNTGDAAKKAAKSTAQMVSDYRKEHSNTRTSTSENEESNKSFRSSEKQVPKLTLTPEHVTAGAQFISEINNTIQTINQINQQNAAAIQRGSKAVDDYTNQVLKTNRRR